MKDYFDVLDIPVTATLDEIKAQYKRLVRIYHPDRFTNPLDKVYAEHKLKELNEAYAVLSANAKAADSNESNRPMPIPIVEPAILEFGTLAVGQRHTAKFKVGNAGGPTKNISFVYSDEHAWYSIAKVRQVFPDKAFPVEIEVVVNPKRLEPSHNYQSWLDVNMDGATSRVELRLHTMPQATPLRLISHRLALVAATCLMIIVTTLALPWARPLRVAFGLPSNQQSSLTQPPAPTIATADVTTVQGSSKESEWVPVFSPNERQVAFVSSQLGSSQVFIRDPQSGRLRQLTRDAAEKRALTWSPDGSRLAFVANDLGRMSVQIFNITKNSPEALAPKVATGEVTRLAWSIDGQSLLYDLLLNNERQFYQANLTDMSVEQIPPPVGWE